MAKNSFPLLCLVAGVAFGQNAVQRKPVPQKIAFSITNVAAGQYPIAGVLRDACTIAGWTLVASGTSASGNITIELDAVANSAPDSSHAPAVPNASTNKISASAPMALSNAATAAGGSSDVLTWLGSSGTAPPLRAQHDSFAINVTGTPTVTNISGTILCQ